MTEETIARLRAALEAGPTPGEWEAITETNDGGGWRQPEQHVAIRSGDVLIADYSTDYTEYPATDAENEANAAFIAAANPEAIRLLLAKLDSQDAELQMRRKSGSASDRLHNICESLAANADGSEFSREEWERIDAENVALRAQVAAHDAALTSAYAEGRRDEREDSEPLRAALQKLLDHCGASYGTLSTSLVQGIARAAMKPQGSE